MGRGISTQRGRALDPARAAIAYWTWYARTIGIWQTRRGGAAPRPAAPQAPLQARVALAPERTVE
jgi:hypothetical protein